MQTAVEIPPSLVYPVRKVGLNTLMPGYTTNSYNTAAIVLDMPGDTKKVVNHCSSDYQLIRNSAIINPIIDGLQDLGPITVRGISWRDAVFSIQIVVGKLLQANGKAIKDTIHPELQILNSYNGKIRCSIRMGMYRVVCENGLSVPEGFDRFSEYSHTPMNEEDIAVSKILSAFEQFLGISDEVAATYNDLKFMPVRNPELRVEEVIENTKFPAKFKEDVMDRFHFEMAAGYKSTDWLVFNAVNYQLNHHPDLMWDPSKRLKVDQEVLTFLLNS